MAGLGRACVVQYPGVHDGHARPQPQCARTAGVPVTHEMLRMSLRIRKARKRVRSLLWERSGLQRAVAVLTGAEDEKWSRVVMRRECRVLLEQLGPERLSALEISGDYYRTLGFNEYMSVRYPDYDVCAGRLQESFDVIIAEQVFEHLPWPYRAGRNIYEMLNPEGFLLVSTPFLVRIHNDPIDCTRWTETGLKYLLAECGFSLEKMKTGSWGNRACVKANLKDWVQYRRRIHSLRNEPGFPYHVWVLAQK